jgi:ABC-type multidrug transport system fused ATPase/permease subunit
VQRDRVSRIAVNVMLIRFSSAKKDELSGNLTDGSDCSSTSSRNLAIKNMSLSIAPGEKVAICGRSGR